MAVTWKKVAYEDDCLLEADLNAKGDLISASADNTLEILTVGANDTVLIADDGEASGLKWGAVPSGGVPAAHKDSHDPNDGSDPLDCAAAGEIVGVVAAAEGTAHSFARSDHTHQIQESMADNHVVTINAADVAENDYARFTATGGLCGLTAAEVAATIALDDVGDPDAAVDFNLQQATDLVVMTVANEAALPAVGIAVGQLCFATGELSLHICTAIA
jgi:hypothetical protein